MRAGIPIRYASFAQQSQKILASYVYFNARNSEYGKVYLHETILDRFVQIGKIIRLKTNKCSNEQFNIHLQIYIFTR